MCEELILLSKLQSWPLLTSLHMKVCQKMLQWMLLVTLSKRTLCMCKILTQNVLAAFCWECAAKLEIKLPSWLSKLWINLLNFHLHCLLQAWKEPWSKPALWWYCWWPVLLTCSVACKLDLSSAAVMLLLAVLDTWLMCLGHLGSVWSTLRKICQVHYLHNPWLLCILFFLVSLMQSPFSHLEPCCNTHIFTQCLWQSLMNILVAC